MMVLSFDVFPGGSDGKESACSVGAAAAAKSNQSYLILCDPMTAAHQAPPSLGFSRKEHWSGVPLPSPAMWETWVPSLGWKDPLEESMATHSSILAWRIPWTDKPGRLHSQT